MKRTIAGLVMLLAGCSNEEKTLETLHKAGFKNITTTGWSAFECSKDDTWSTGFVATNSAGERVEGTVCCGLVLKGCTVRF